MKKAISTLLSIMLALVLTLTFAAPQAARAATTSVTVVKKVCLSSTLVHYLSVSTSGNVSNVSETDWNVKVDFQTSTPTVTLRGLNTSPVIGFYGLYANGEMNLVLQGHNSITLDEDINVGLSGAECIVIRSDGNLTVSGDGTLTATLHNTSSLYGRSIWTQANYIQNSGHVTAIAESPALNSVSVSSSADVIINGGTLTAISKGTDATARSLNISPDVSQYELNGTPVTCPVISRANADGTGADIDILNAKYVRAGVGAMTSEVSIINRYFSTFKDAWAYVASIDTRYRFTSVKLYDDVVAGGYNAPESWPITTPSSESSTIPTSLGINLNGYNIDQKGTGDTSTIVVSQNSSLYLEDSTDTGGLDDITGRIMGGNGNPYQSYPGGVMVQPGGFFTMASGSIAENQYGGVSVLAGGSFAMQGGRITGNASNPDNAGGVTIHGTFTMQGGSITKNDTTGSGAVVMVGDDAVFNVSGTPYIGQNLNDGGDPITNVYLQSDDTINIVGSLKNPATGATARIGVTMADLPADGQRAITAASDEQIKNADYDPAACFLSDQAGYTATRKGNTIYLEKTVVTIAGKDLLSAPGANGKAYYYNGAATSTAPTGVTSNYAMLTWDGAASDPSNLVLTLYGLQATNGSDVSTTLFASVPLTLCLSGESALTNSNTTGDLSVIYCTKDMTIMDDPDTAGIGRLTAVGNTTAADVTCLNNTGVGCGGTLTISSGTIDATSGTISYHSSNEPHISSGICAASYMQTGGTVKATGEVVFPQSIPLSNYSYGVNADTIMISGGSLTASAPSESSQCYALRTAPDLNGYPSAYAAVIGPDVTTTEPYPSATYPLSGDQANYFSITPALAEVAQTVGGTALKRGFPTFAEAWIYATGVTALTPETAPTVKLLANVDIYDNPPPTRYEPGYETTPFVWPIKVPSAMGGERHIRLDLNGYTIDRGLSGASVPEEYGYILQLDSPSNLTLLDTNKGNNPSGNGVTGKLTGSYDANSGCVYIPRNSTFTMDGGIITGNRTDGSGAGVWLGDGSASLVMNGGSITGNTAGGSGGGVYADGDQIVGNAALVMNGGSITDNKAGANGAGVYVGEYVTLNISGAPVITGNKQSSALTPNNVYLTTDAKMGVTGALTADASIGVTTQATGVVAITLPSAYANAATFTDDTQGRNTFIKDGIVYFGNQTTAPTIAPAAGTYQSPLTVTISAAQGATIYYTTDGTAPTTASSVYPAAGLTLTAGGSTTVKAIAVAAGSAPSEVVSATYVITQAPLPHASVTPQSSFIIGEASALTLVVDADASGFNYTNNFLGVTVDGRAVSEGGSTFTGSNGSIRLAFKPAYLNKLAVGDHTFTVLLRGAGYAGASVSTTITVLPRIVPPLTGDDAPLTVLLVMMLLSIVLGAALLPRLKHR